MKIKSRKRLFIGISANNEIKNLLIEIQSSIQYKSEQIKWISPDNIHLTLFFMGDVLLDYIPRLTKSLNDILDIPRFYINIESTGTFPSNDCPKILWLGISKGKFELVELFKKIEKAVVPFNKVGTKEHFIPHVSIGRTTKFYGKVNVLPFLKYVYSPIKLGVDSVTLFESQLLPNGAKYSALTEFQLK